MMNKDMIIKILLDANDIDNFTDKQCDEMIQKLENRKKIINENKMKELIVKIIQRCPEECKELFKDIEEVWCRRFNPNDVDFGSFIILYNNGNILAIRETYTVYSARDKEKENKGDLVRPLLIQVMDEINMRKYNVENSKIFLK